MQWKLGDQTGCIATLRDIQGFVLRGNGTIVAEYQLVSAIKAKRRKNFKEKVFIAVGWEGSREVE